MKKQKISLRNVKILSDKLFNDIKKSHNITGIVAIARGGLVPARYLASLFGIRRIYSIGIEFYTENSRREGANNVPEIYQRLQNNFSADDIILLVDDIIDSGKSMWVATSELRRHGVSKIITCSLHYKPQSSFTPNFYAESIKNNTWVVYDWEID